MKVYTDPFIFASFFPIFASFVNILTNEVIMRQPRRATSPEAAPVIVLHICVLPIHMYSHVSHQVQHLDCYRKRFTLPRAKWLTS